MDVKIQTLELIDRYLNGELKGKELEDFEIRLDSDTSFNKLVEEQQIILFGIQDSARSTLKVKLDDIHHTLYGKNKNQVNNYKRKSIVPFGWKRGLAIAASVTLLLITWFYFEPQQPDVLFADKKELIIKPNPEFLGSSKDKEQGINQTKSIEKIVNIIKIKKGEAYFKETENELTIYLIDNLPSDTFNLFKINENQVMIDFLNKDDIIIPIRK